MEDAAFLQEQPLNHEEHDIHDKGRGAEGEPREPGDGVGEGTDRGGPEMRLRNQRNAGRGDKHAEREKRPALPVIN